MAKYDPLKNYLINLPKNQMEVTLSFEQVEKIIGAKLPPAAREHRAYWGNNAGGGHAHALAWMEAGWKVDSVNQKDFWVRFVRQRIAVKPVKPVNIPEPIHKQMPENFHRTTEYSANNPNKTLVIHKPDCNRIPWGKLSGCGCGDTGDRGNQYWFCEEHVTHEAVDEFMNGRFWAILICDVCFGNRIG